MFSFGFRYLLLYYSSRNLVSLEERGMGVKDECGVGGGGGTREKVEKV